MDNETAIRRPLCRRQEHDDERLPKTYARGALTGRCDSRPAMNPNIRSFTFDGGPDHESGGRMSFDDDENTTIELDESVRARFAAPGELDLSEEELELILGDVIEGTVVCCGQCGDAYLLADDIADERLFRVCPDCVETLDP